MRVVLFQSVPNVGLAGDLLDVKPGFFRNYLEPRGYALRETPATLRLLASKKKKIEQALLKERSQAEEARSTLASLKVPPFRLKAGEKGRLFGSVTNRDVAEALEKMGVVVDRHKIELPEAIKSIGEHTARVRLHPQVVAEVTLVVEPDKPMAPVATPAPAKVEFAATEAPASSANAPETEEQKEPDIVPDQPAQ